MKLSIIVQRWHRDVSGGAERTAQLYAEILSRDAEVTLLTTTALDADTWLQSLPAGKEEHGPIKVVRFPVTVGRTSYWADLHQQLLRETEVAVREGRPRFTSWPDALQEEWIRAQGPHSVPLLDYLAANAASADAFICFTYLYSPTYFGSLVLPKKKSLLVPTLHDEAPAHLPVFKKMAGRFQRLLWLTDAEREVGRELWGDLPGSIAGGPVHAEDPDQFTVAPLSTEPYLLYSGRLDAGKGLPQMFAYFERIRRRHPNLKLLLTGNRSMGLPILARLTRAVRYLGFVSESEKFRLMRGAVALVMPSLMESFSVSTLEALGQGTPVIVARENPVLTAHVERSGCGWSFTSFEEFAEAVGRALDPSRPRTEQGRNGIAYVQKMYGSEKIRANLLSEIGAL